MSFLRVTGPSCGLLAVLLGVTAAAAERNFEKIVLTDKYYCDGIQAGDINRDGQLDIVAGPFWYAGPTFAQAAAFYPPVALPPEKTPSDSMFSFVHDFSGDGWPESRPRSRPSAPSLLV